MTVRISRSQLKRIVVAIDPAVTVSEDSDETGIIVVARGPHQPDTCQFEQRCPGHGYVLEDCSGKYTPSQWARVAIGCYDRWDADRIIAEVNNGGDMVGETIHSQRLGVPYLAVRATRGKFTRAEPISGLYEQGRVHHIGSFSLLEEQLTTWTGEGDSPDRLDALVWGLTALQLIGGQGQAFISAWQDEQSAADTKAPKDPVGNPEPFRHLPRFEQYTPNKYKTTCSRGVNGRHRFFGQPLICVFCGCESPLQVVAG